MADQSGTDYIQHVRQLIEQAGIPIQPTKHKWVQEAPAMWDDTSGAYDRKRATFRKGLKAKVAAFEAAQDKKKALTAIRAFINSSRDHARKQGRHDPRPPAKKYVRKTAPNDLETGVLQQKLETEMAEAAAAVMATPSSPQAPPASPPEGDMTTTFGTGGMGHVSVDDLMAAPEVAVAAGVVVLPSGGGQ